ncbi:GAF domain-containing protein [Leptolyngbya cf. ectocarpi LEGE 11479]|uniref:histidine kinase n=1 Tax=Leptolyngbya cf. ectocarpi LEGE 11479 TaxID=1828722 RepID=A0A928X3H6_LEPEC|nr:ATP-binding protein [Leptolyngbya ectocarpi]MBE9067205.1 GAF domain-containing protein [Leptolyngbya cf. ectocarpi LEGE 11479]
MTALDFIVQTKAKIAAITEPQTDAADLTNCDREPIHSPAAIQPHGIMVVLDSSWTIQKISQNTSDHLGRVPDELLGQPLSVLVSNQQIQQIAACLEEEFDTVNPLQVDISVDDETQTFSGVVHRSDRYVVLELEPTAAPTSANFFDFYRLVKRPVSRLQKTQTLDELCQVAVSEMKQITGFDRVMVYRFDDDGAGSVIAEAKQEEMSPFLGLHYPPSDIPKQAKYLYLLNLLRLIPNVVYTPVPLLSVPDVASDVAPDVAPDAAPDAAPDDDTAPLDMSLATLRSVSPLHVEYLANMGVQASMSISLICDRKLWGLIACHHSSPKKLSYEMRTTCEFLGQVVALEIPSLEKNEDSDYRFNLNTIQASVVKSLGSSQTLHQGLTQNPDTLMALANAAGVAYCEHSKITLLGHTPTQEDVKHLVSWLDQQLGQDVVYQTSALSAVYPAAANFASGVSGLLALSISQKQQIYLLWFRPEVPQTVNWAGNPKKATEIDTDGHSRISPRKSFDLWKEMVRQRSLPWKPCEVETALELRSAITGLVLKKADELAELNSELQRSNAELDAFAYVASHDLKEPLRGIHNYSSFLIEDYGDQLGDDGTKKLRTLMKLTQRMEDLINSLLHYSRLGRTEFLMKPVDLNQLVDSVVEVIKISKPEQVSFRIPQSLPTLTCDQSQVNELLTNLVSNAIKYNNKAEKWVEISYLDAKDCPNAPVAADATIFYVRDNGIGIRPRHLEAVFRIFKRLHAPGKYGGGTGVGLTIAKKIVERHGGTIWLDSIYGEGTTFYFTLTN